MYLPCSADTNSEVRKVSAQILDQLFSISLSLPRPAASKFSVGIVLSYGALSSLEDVIAILRSVILSRNSFLLLPSMVSHQLYVIKSSSQLRGAIQAVVEFVTKRGHEPVKIDVSRFSYLKISVVLKDFRILELCHILNFLNISSLSENTSSKIVFNDVLATAGRDVVAKDISRLPGGWSMQDAFYISYICFTVRKLLLLDIYFILSVTLPAFSQHTVLSSLFLEHVIFVLSQPPILRGDSRKGENSSHLVDGQMKDDVLQAAIFALNAFFRGGGTVGKKAIEQSYASVLAELTLQLGSFHGLVSTGQYEPLRGGLSLYYLVELSSFTFLIAV
ncbi:protein shoot gravitropism 6 [Quercus suber]|uniref:Protein shoot gravitropism 6 n=1 Tax=Quercus suber TaxID=58331 RepID=A0AAW0KGC9_QUESU